MSRLTAGGLGLLLCLLVGCGRTEHYLERVTVAEGATFAEIADSLHARGVVRSAFRLRVYARLRGVDRAVKPGTYDLPSGASWAEILDVLVSGRSVGYVLTIPEGARIAEIGDRIGPLVGLTPQTVVQELLRPSLADSLGAPGPTMEGYLFPATYRLEAPMTVEGVASLLYQRYREVWTEARQARLDSLGMSERELATLASLIRAETFRDDELPLVSAVFHNRLRQGMQLQADVTIRYALPVGAGVSFRDIDQLADHPYNTYFIDGLPPGPVGAPDELAIDAALSPADEPYLFFVAGPDGRSVFSTTFDEHRSNIERLRGRVP